jgi:hypothetical protein
MQYVNLRDDRKLSSIHNIKNKQYIIKGCEPNGVSSQVPKQSYKWQI